MVSLKLQKRLAAAVLKCGKRKVWMDPSEVSNIAVANSRQSVRAMIKNGMIVKKHNLMHSRARVNIRHEAKARGNHTGYGKRHGTMNARIPEKLLWMRRIRVLRRLLRKYRDAGKIDKHMYAHFYALAKGNRYKTKRVLIEQIHRKKGEDKKDAVSHTRIRPHNVREGRVESDGSLQLSFFQLDDPVLSSLKEDLESADLNNMTPLQAFDLLRTMKDKLGIG